MGLRLLEAQNNVRCASGCYGTYPLIFHESCQRRRTAVHPTLTSLLPVPVIDVQSLEKDHRSAGEHPKSTTKGF